VVGDHHDVMLEGWAIVDNTSGEDWKNVLVGVGSSSALSFRYDLWSVRQVQRETLANEARFAIAPPTGISPYGGAKPGEAGEVLLSELGDDEIRRPEGHPDDARTKRVAAKEDAATLSLDGGPVNVEATSEALSAPSSSGSVRPGRPRSRAEHQPAKMRAPAPRPADPRIAGGDQKMKQISQSLVHSDKTIVVEGYAGGSDADANRRANDRANIVRNQLIDQGVAPGRIKVVTKVAPNQPERVRLVAQAARPEEAKPANQRSLDVDAQPVGESHFANPKPMTVERGSSAMVSMVRRSTEGEVVYLYDAE